MFEGALRVLWERVLENPDDLHPRQVLGDALQEQGDPYGEFITLQCQLAATPADEQGLEQLQMLARCRALFSVHGLHWLGRWPMGKIPDFERGFPHHLSLDANELAEHAGWLFKSAPTLRSVRLTNEDPAQWGAGLSRLLMSRGLDTLRSLALPIALMPADVEALASLQGLENLHALTFQGGTVAERGIQALVQSAFRRSLRELTFEFDAGWGSRWPVALGAFELTSFASRANELPDIAHTFPGLKTLKLAEAPLAHVRGITTLAQLETLELDRVQLGRKGLDALRAGHATVRRLALTREPHALDVLDKEDRWPRLQSLDLRGAGVTDDQLAKLVERPFVQRLRRLGLENNLLTDKSAATLAGAAVPQLQRLEIRGNALSRATISRLENRGWLVVV